MCLFKMIAAWPFNLYFPSKMNLHFSFWRILCSLKNRYFEKKNLDHNFHVLSSKHTASYSKWDWPRESYWSHCEWLWGSMFTLAFVPVVRCYPFGIDWDCNPLPVDCSLHPTTVTSKLVTWQHAGKFKDQECINYNFALLKLVIHLP